MSLAEITGAIGSVLAGGATGLLGIVVQRWADHKKFVAEVENKKNERAHELALRKLDGELMEKEYASRVHLAEIEVEGKIEQADAQNFSPGFQEPSQYSANVVPSAGQGWSLVLLDFIRGIVRPGLTLYLSVLTTMIYFQAYTLITREGMTASPEENYALLNEIVNTILYLFTTCVLWWFGTRNRGKAPSLGR